MAAKQTYLSKSPKETKSIAEKLARKLKSGAVLALIGDLGGGKTTFAQGFAKGLGIKEKILSPTFVIMKKFNNFYHIDCYRLKNERDLLDLGFKDILKDKKNVVLIEWPERIKKILPKRTIKVSFKFLNDKEREIEIYGK